MNSKWKALLERGVSGNEKHLVPSALWEDHTFNQPCIEKHPVTFNQHHSGFICMRDIDFFAQSKNIEIYININIYEIDIKINQLKNLTSLLSKGQLNTLIYERAQIS